MNAKQYRFSGFNHLPVAQLLTLPAESNLNISTVAEKEPSEPNLSEFQTWKGPISWFKEGNLQRKKHETIHIQQHLSAAGNNAASDM